MQKKLLLIACICTFRTVLVFGQNVTILSAATQQPLENVTLSSTSPRASAITNTKGIAALGEFKGSEKIYIRMLGFETRIVSYDFIASNEFIIMLTPENTSLTEVIVSVSKWEQAKNKVPNSVISLKKKDIEKMQVQTTADLLGTTGKVFIQKSQLGGGSPMIRGFATNRVLLSVDGVRMNNAIFRSGNLQNVLSIDANSIQNTEVILGPGSVIYGSDAIGGVMNFITLQPVLSTDADSCQMSGNIMSRWSSANNEKTTHFNFNVGYQKWAFLSSVTFSDFDDLMMGRHGSDRYLRPDYVQNRNGMDEIVENSNPRKQIPGGYSQLNIMQKILFQPSQELWFEYGFHYATTSDFVRYDQLIRRRNDGTLRNAEWYYGPQNWSMHHLKATYQKATRWFDGGQMNASYQRFGESRHSRAFNNPLRYNNIEKVDAYSLSFDFYKAFDSHQRLNYGIEYILNDVYSYGNTYNITSGATEPAPPRYPHGSNWQSLAAYMQYENRIAKQWTFQGGLRFNQIWLNAFFNSDFYNFPFHKTEINTSAFTGSAGIIFEPAVHSLLFANIGTAFRSPNIDDVGKVFESTPGNIVIPNNTLRSEYAWNGEIGWQQRLGRFLQLDFAAYYTLLQDALVRRDFILNGESTLIFQGEESNIQAIQNAAKAYTYGVQGSVTFSPLPRLNWRTVANWNRGVEELDNGEKAPLRHAAPFFGETHLTYQDKKWFFDLFAVYNARIRFEDLAPSEVEKAFLYELDENGNPFSPEWYTLNLRNTYAFNRNWSVSLNVENITDQRYRPYSSGITAPGRNVIVAARVAF